MEEMMLREQRFPVSKKEERRENMEIRSVKLTSLKDQFKSIKHKKKTEK
jgi:hypothetical protein